MTRAAPPPLLIMGVAGSGKSALGRLLAEATASLFFDGDDFHPPENVARMRAGQPLTDADRAGWLDNIAAAMALHAQRRERCIVACSALKVRYRDRLRAAAPDLRVIFLDVPQAVAASRVGARRGHYMPASLVPSQFASLEAPRGEANTLALDACAPLQELVEQARQWWLDGTTIDER